MSVFAATESDLALRIRRALAGRTRRTGARSRALTALHLAVVCTVALPSTGLGDSRDKDDFDWQAVAAIAPEDWSDDLKEQILQAVARRLRHGQEKAETRDEAKTRDGIDWETVKTTPPEEWSDELKSQILAAGHELRAIAQRVRQALEKAATRDEAKTRDSVDFDWKAAAAIAPEDWSDDLKEQILQAVAQRLRYGQEKATARDEAKTRDGVDWEAVKTTPPEEWSDDLKAQLVAAGYDPQALADRVRQGQRAKRESASDLENTGRRIRAAIGRGELTPEEGRERYAAARQRLQESDEASDLENIGRRIRAAIASGEMTIEEGRERYAAARQRLQEAGGGDGDDRLRDFRRGVAARAMATATEEWSDELKAAIVRAGWDLAEFTEGIRERQRLASESRDPSSDSSGDPDDSQTGTAVEGRSWGQVKSETADPE